MELVASNLGRLCNTPGCIVVLFCFIFMQQVRSRMMTRAKADSTQQLLLQGAHSNGSLQSKSQSKRSRKQAHPTSAHTSKVEAASPNSQGGVTSSSHPAENVTTSKRQVGNNNNAFDETEAAGTESPAVIDGERLGSKHFLLSFVLFFFLKYAKHFLSLESGTTSSING